MHKQLEAEPRSYSNNNICHLCNSHIAQFYQSLLLTMCSFQFALNRSLWNVLLSSMFIFTGCEEPTLCDDDRRYVQRQDRCTSQQQSRCNTSHQNWIQSHIWKWPRSDLKKSLICFLHTSMKKDHVWVSLGAKSSYLVHFSCNVKFQWYMMSMAKPQVAQHTAAAMDGLLKYPSLDQSFCVK